MDQVWANRAASSEAAITQRNLRRLWGLPGTQLAVVAWPDPIPRDRYFGRWGYWWQAHVIDLLVDAQVRDPQAARQKSLERQIRAHRIRNAGKWTNSYYDDMAWLALALERAGRLAGVARPKAMAALAEQFMRAWVPEDGGGIPWRKQDQFFNAPANGPAAIYLARVGELRRAQQMADWIDETLLDPDHHLIYDGIKGGSIVSAEYSYCQGVVLGLETELAIRTTDPEPHLRVQRLVAAVSKEMSTDGVISTGGGGDGGLFNGVLARNLALVAVNLPGESPDDVAARETARSLVLKSAQSLWDYRQTVDGLPVYGPFWNRAAQVPKGGGKEAEFTGGAVNESEVAERDLAVQLSGWMLMEAAYAVEEGVAS
ncbi:MAG: glycoside hydrolase family 76 protein [Mycobacterium sp.]